MKIQLKKSDKIELLKAIGTGYLDTEKIPELDIIIKEREPAKLLSKEEARQFIIDLNNSI
jgi:hypothetical protein